MPLSRRDFVIGGAAAAVITTEHLAHSREEKNMLPLIDTHQHLWDLQRQNVPWVPGADKVLNLSLIHI